MKQIVGMLIAWLAAGWAIADTRDAPRVIGYLSERGPPQALVRSLAALGYREGREIRFETRSADLDPVRMAQAAGALLATRPDILVADGPYVVALAQATRAIPIVCAGLPDPVGAGLARSLRQPGGNVTGLSTGSTETAGMVFEILRTLRPQGRRIAVLHSPGAPVAVQMRAHRDAALAAGFEWSFVPVVSVEDARRALASHAGETIWLAPIHGDAIVDAVTDGAVGPKVAMISGHPKALMWYQRGFTDPWERVAAIADRLLRGAKPADIPFENPDRQVFMLNRATARALGIDIPPAVLLRATEVID